MGDKEFYHAEKYYLEPDISRSVFAYSRGNSFQPPPTIYFQPFSPLNFWYL